MSAVTLIVWSLALGAIAAVALARAGDLLVRPGGSAARSLAYHASVFLLVVVESGLLRELVHPPPERLRILQVLAGPVCVGLWNFWIHGWLAAADRDRTMAAVLRVSAFTLPPLALAALALPPEQQLPGATLLALAGGTFTCWATVRAWTIGDRLALAMAGGCALMLPALAGLYLLAMGDEPAGTVMQAAVALAAAVGNALTGRALWRRMLRKWRTRETGSALAIDPVTKVHSSAALVHRLVAAQKRHLRTRREGALLAVRVFEPERIVAAAGTGGLDEVWMTLALRIQREVGIVNPVGRYWDRCFVALAETIPARGWLRTVGLRLAFSLRQPVEVTGRNGEPVRVRVDYGVGVLHLPVQHAEAEDVLDDVQRLAVAARGLRSRAATLDAASGAPVPLEEATFGQPPPPSPPGRASRPVPLHGRAP
jgi:GGDEF domain-containing protein